MTLGRDILYAALAGLMHGGLTVYPARRAGLRYAAPLALWGRSATHNFSTWMGWKQTAPLALGGGRAAHNRPSCLSCWAEVYRAVGALGQAQRAVIPQPKASPWVCEYP
jgi:hypothetical protein